MKNNAEDTAFRLFIYARAHTKRAPHPTHHTPMKQLLTTHTLILLALSALSGCASDEYLGSPSDVADVERGQTISFNSEAGKTARASALLGQDAATKLNDQFVVYGTKTSGGTTQTVFDHYSVSYADGTALTTASNSAGWEYVGQPLSATSTLPPGSEQTIKYWDLSADSYDFVAFSSGSADLQAVSGTPGDGTYPGTPASGKVIVTPVQPSDLTTAAYTLTGATADLTACYIADRITATRNADRREHVSYPYRDAMKFGFYQLGSKVRIGIYETIPGYSVQNVKFYHAADDFSSSLSTTPLLFAGSAEMPASTGSVTVSFPVADPASTDYNRARTTYTGSKIPDVTLGNMETDTYVVRENLEGGKSATPGKVFLGRSAATATTSAYQSILPTGAPHALTLKMDYTLLSTDISRETIEVRGATAVVPAEFCNWQSNTAYTYLFKISENTSGWTNPDAPAYAGLYPITFDAIVAATEEGVQQTITLMSAPSITTYAKGERVHEDANRLNYYEAGDYNLYICLQPSTLTMNTGNVKMYMASTSDSSPIIEATVEDVIKNGTQDPVGTFTAGPATVTTSGAPTLTITEAISAADAPYGTAIDGNFATFRPTTAGTYVFEYTSPEEHYTYEEYRALSGNEGITPSEFAALTAAQTLKPNKHYKVIVVKNNP